MKTILKFRLAFTTAGLLAGNLFAADTGATNVPSSVVAADHYHSAYEIFWTGYVPAMEKKPVDLIFIGDSITEQWIHGQGKAVWEKYYAERALDFGQGGDKTQNVLWRFEHLTELKHFKPKVAVILIGTNNTGDAPADIAAGVQAVITATRKQFAGVKIILVSILPNQRANEKMMAANALLKPFADDQTVFYLDLGPLFPPVGDNWQGLQSDHLHLTAAGYETWAAALNPLIEKLIPARK